MILVCLELPRGVQREQFDPFPGDDDAFERGCTCPVQMGWPHVLQLDAECPMHELEKSPH